MRSRPVISRNVVGFFWRNFLLLRLDDGTVSGGPMQVSERGIGSRDTHKTRTEFEYTVEQHVSGDDNQGRCAILTLDCDNSHSDVEELLWPHKALQGCQTRATAIKGGSRTSTRPGIVMRLLGNVSNRRTPRILRARQLPNE